MSSSLLLLARGVAMALFLLLVSVYPKTGNAADNSGGTAEDDKRRFEKEFADQKLRAEQGDPKSQYQWGLSCIYDQQGSSCPHSRDTLTQKLKRAVAMRLGLALR